MLQKDRELLEAVLRTLRHQTLLLTDLVSLSASVLATQQAQLPLPVYSAVERSLKHVQSVLSQTWTDAANDARARAPK